MILPLIQPTELLKARNALSRRIDHTKVKLTLFDLFINSCPNLNSRRALMADIKDLESYLTKIHDLSLLSANLQHLGAYREVLVTRGNSVATIKRRVASIRKLYKFLFIEGVIQTNIAINLEAPKLYRTTGATPVFDKDDLVDVLESFDINYPVEARNKLAISLMYYTACRVGALVQIQVKDLKRLASHYEVRLQEKRGAIHTVVTHPDLTTLLDHFLDICGFEDGYLFRSTRRGWSKFTDKAISTRGMLGMIKTTCGNLGIDTIYGNHSLRATSITNHLANGGRLQEAKKLANHKSADQTSMYNRDANVIKLEEVLRLSL
jgi:integrase/recombinase XerD